MQRIWFNYPLFRAIVVLLLSIVFLCIFMLPADVILPPIATAKVYTRQDGLWSSFLADSGIEALRNLDTASAVTLKVCCSRELAEQLQKEWTMQVVYEFKQGDCSSIYGFSPFFGKGVWMQGKYINVQLAYSNGCLCIGLPLIAEGF